MSKPIEAGATMPRRHTELGDMARECAEHHGQMVVDIEIEPSGRKHIRAVAFWDDEGHSADLSRMADDGCPHHD